MREHRKWIVVMGYFNEISSSNKDIKYIKNLIDKGNNVLVMIKKEDPKNNPKVTSEQKHKMLFTLFREDSIKGKLILSIVPDILDTRDLEQRITQ